MDIQDIVRRFEIGEPLKSLFKPRFRAETGRDNGLQGAMSKITLVSFAPDAYGGPVIEINLQRIVPEFSDERHVFGEMRRMLHDMLLHEADEAILVDGRRIYDPHKGGL